MLLIQYGIFPTDKSKKQAFNLISSKSSNKNNFYL